MMRYLNLLILVSLTAVSGCARSGSHPYQSISIQSRNPEQAIQLARQAAELVETNPTKAEELLRESLSLCHRSPSLTFSFLFICLKRSAAQSAQNSPGSDIVAPQCGLAQVAIAVGLITIMGIIAQWIMWRKKSTAK